VQLQEGFSLPEEVQFVAKNGEAIAPFPEGRDENSPGWSEAESGDSVPTPFSRPVGPRRTSLFKLDHVQAIALGGCPVLALGIKKNA